MIDHFGNAAEQFTCAGCKQIVKPGSFYHRLGNDIYCKTCDPGDLE